MLKTNNRSVLKKQQQPKVNDMTTLFELETETLHVVKKMQRLNK